MPLQHWCMIVDNTRPGPSRRDRVTPGPTRLGPSAGPGFIRRIGPCFILQNNLKPSRAQLSMIVSFSAEENYKVDYIYVLLQSCFAANYIQHADKCKLRTLYTSFTSIHPMSFHQCRPLTKQTPNYATIWRCAEKTWNTEPGNNYIKITLRW